MKQDEKTLMLARIADGRTDLVFEYLSQGYGADSRDNNGVSLIQWCAYYGDVSAIRLLLEKGESLTSLGENLDLQGAAFHGHWQLTQFLIEHGADVNHPQPETGETPLHAALCKSDQRSTVLIVKILLSRGANPNSVTKASAETGSFMRDSRTKVETPLHRAAAFGSEETIRLLLESGATIDVKDMNGDSPLSWASWHLRPDSILRKLLYDGFSVHPERRPMSDNLLGKPYT